MLNALIPIRSLLGACLVLHANSFVSTCPRGSWWVPFYWIHTGRGPILGMPAHLCGLELFFWLPDGVTRELRKKVRVSVCTSTCRTAVVNTWTAVWAVPMSTVPTKSSLTSPFTSRSRCSHVRTRCSTMVWCFGVPSASAAVSTVRAAG